MDSELTPEQEATLDAQADEQERDDWLASWADDFNSDEWLVAATISTTRVLP